MGWTAAEERVDAACAEEDAALEALVATLPTTVSGAAALASSVASSCQRCGSVQDYAETALATVGKALAAPGGIGGAA